MNEGAPAASAPFAPGLVCPPTETSDCGAGATLSSMLQKREWRFSLRKFLGGGGPLDWVQPQDAHQASLLRMNSFTGYITVLLVGWHVQIGPWVPTHQVGGLGPY